MSPDTPRYTGQPLGKGATAQKLEEIKLKKPYPLVVNLEAPRPLHTPRRLGRTQLPPHLTESCASDRPWAVSIWRQAYPQHARHAAQAALQIAIKLDARPIIALDHGEALGPAPFHGIPPTPRGGTPRHRNPHQDRRSGLLNRDPPPHPTGGKGANAPPRPENRQDRILRGAPETPLR